MSIPQFPELFLRHIWQHQLFTSDGLHTANGKPVTILSPGQSNSDAGPDFTDARIRIGNITFYGDVELHCDASSWETHGHHTDPHYNRVILHVVLTDKHPDRPARTSTRRHLPLLILHPFLDPVLDEQLKQFSESAYNARMTIPCQELNHDVPSSVIATWIDHLAEERLELKIRRFEERLRQLVDERRMIVREPYPRYYGDPDEIPDPAPSYNRKDYAPVEIWEQLLFEGIMEGLGYAKNQAPFLALAQSMRLSWLRERGQDRVDMIMALLFGAAGLLPPRGSIREKESGLYARRLRSLWSAERKGFGGQRLHAADWTFFRLRPANFPTLRLAAMSFLFPKLFSNHCMRALIRLVKADGTPRDCLASLHELFTYTPDQFWQYHYHFGRKSVRVVPRLGRGRVNEIITNAILPIFLLYARIFRDRTIRERTRSVLLLPEMVQENSTTRLMRKHLFGTRVPIETPFRQQGTIQLFSFYCKNHRCEECAIGKEISW